MSRHAPHVTPGLASTMLALVDHARGVEPEAPLSYLRGFLVARSVEPVASHTDPRREPEEGERLGRVALGKRPP